VMEYKPENLSPLPIVDLTTIAMPADGWAIKRNSYCNKKFRQGEVCKKFYSDLVSSGTKDKLTQCPFGFSAYSFSLAGRPYAFTCLIPAPRRGGDDERARAKEHSETKISVEDIVKLAKNLDASEKARLTSVDKGLQSYPSALHEIRKYNRTIKQEAERLCMEQSPSDPDKADSRLVSIFKGSELMTLQFEVLELIANQSLVTLPLNYTSEVYKIFEKCVRILQGTEMALKKGLILKINGDSPKAKVNDKTFHIIATVLLENAIKYSIPQTEIIVRVRQLSPERCEVAVNNIAPHVNMLPNIFEKGVRGSNDGTGMGYGLFLAQQVAKQHSSEIRVKTLKFSENKDSFIFSFELNTIIPKEKFQ
jgi:K+-sensing histidine kinase KdpD